MKRGEPIKNCCKIKIISRTPEDDHLADEIYVIGQKNGRYFEYDDHPQFRVFDNKGDGKYVLYPLSDMKSYRIKLLRFKRRLHYEAVIEENRNKRLNHSLPARYFDVEIVKQYYNDQPGITD